VNYCYFLHKTVQ